jgi:hypothetical protein
MAAACGRPPARLAPAAFEPVDATTFRAVAARTVPGARELIQFHWRFDDGDHEVNGRGAARLAPPDSLRLDVSVPVLGRATVVFAGESAWADPTTLTQEVLPPPVIVWAMFGVVRLPGPGTRIEVGDAADRRVYRLTAPDGLLTALEFRGDTLLGATQTKNSRPVGGLVLTRDAAGRLVKADATDEAHGARFVVAVDHREASGPFPDEIWRRR